ncbi:MAG: hypothetical protein LBI16_05420 [Burkholderiales bacterium]|jgi:hypothetical protein|nr:hypothetical protein [Burkholderiales bacterium]
MPRFPIRLFNAKRLAQELGRKELGPRVLGYYLAAGALLFIPLSYSGFTYVGQPLWSWLSIYEGFAIFAITVWGFSASYFASGGDDNPNFITEFICLSVPVFFTTTLIVWSVFWGITIGLRECYELYEYQFFRNLYSMAYSTGSNLQGLLNFLAVVSTQAIGFYRITKLFRIVRSSSP